QSKRRLQAVCSAERRRNPNRAPLVAPECDVHLPGRDGGCRTGRGATRQTGHVVRIERSVEITRDTRTPRVGGPIHVVLTDHPASGSEHSPDDGRVEVGDVPLHPVRTKSERNARNRNVVLEADGLPDQWSGTCPFDDTLPKPSPKWIL